jgi:hypothetical protein
MVGSKSNTRGAEAWKLARRQHGIVTRRQLLALGFGPRSIEHRLSKGRLHLVMRGVYAVGWSGLSQKQHWMAAVLACGDGAALSHHSAGALWGIATERTRCIDVSVRRRCRIRRPGLRVRSRPALAAADITSRDGMIPLTSVVTTIIDLATELGSSRLERTVNEADKLELIDPAALRSCLDLRPGEAGVPVLRHLLDRQTFLLSDSDLEISFRPIARSAGLPQPLSKQVVNGFEVDFFWPDLGLVVETDGLRYHRTPSAQSRDARRDRTHVIAGMSPLRFTHYEIRYEPSRVREGLEGAIAMLRERVGL